MKDIDNVRVCAAARAQRRRRERNCMALRLPTSSHPSLGLYVFFLSFFLKVPVAVEHDLRCRARPAAPNPVRGPSHNTGAVVIAFF